ncbi:hypothetical protein [Streptomyces rubiginosohelvolus]|uniref:hypothetical protein n=1 Tax=Streptomyces rubiginosohelvolus TaxID=67362 RepID=UPI0036EB85D2
MPGPKYTEQEKLTYLELATTIGHSRAMRELGYPKHWSTANSWAKEFNVTIALDELKQKAAEFNDWYGTEEQLIAMQEVISRGREFILYREDLTPDELKKTAEAMKRAIETMQLLQGKATSRTGTEEGSETDAAIRNLLSAFESDEQTTAGQRDQGGVS